MENLPITVKRSIEIIGLFTLGVILVLGQQIIAPLLTAFLVCILLMPIYRFLRKYKFPEVVAILVCIIVLIVIVGGIGWFFSAQMGKLVADFPKIKHNVLNHLHALSSWIQSKTHFSSQEQVKMVKDKSDEIWSVGGDVAKSIALSFSSVLIFVGLLPIYIFLIMFYRKLILRFIFYWFPEKNHHQVEEVVHETEAIVKSYLVGLLIQMTYITILLGGLLWILGIKYAFLIGVIFALLNLIPYVGALIGNLLAALLTLSSSQQIWDVVLVIGSIGVVQFLDNNILMPRIVGSKVKINPLVSIVGVIIGGTMAGISGMFLSLPIIAILKIIFDRTAIFKQWGILIGDDRPTQSPLKKTRKKTKKQVD